MEWVQTWGIPESYKTLTAATSEGRLTAPIVIHRSAPDKDTSNIADCHLIALQSTSLTPHPKLVSKCPPQCSSPLELCSLHAVASKRHLPEAGKVWPSWRYRDGILFAVRA
jgi:hypothetical protein